VSPRINESCDGCHVESTSGKAAVLTPRAASVFSVKGAFDHAAHARADRVGTQGRECLTCHENIKDAEADNLVPLPTMQGCQQACHDGKKAFDALGTTCTRCHTQGGR
jgi:c(7)-type cytochrome triheme protein